MKQLAYSQTVMTGCAFLFHKSFKHSWFFSKALRGFIRRISKGCIQAASSRNSKCSSVLARLPKILLRHNPVRDRECQDLHLALRPEFQECI